MICSVCLNPCIDRTVEIDAFAYGGLNRIRASRSDGCGKGVNVALVAREMGMEASVIGFLFEENGRCIAERLESAGFAEWVAELERQFNEYLQEHPYEGQ